MRKLVPILLIALAAPTAALARGKDSGDGTLAVKNASATIQIVAKGSILGRLEAGTVTITDWNPTDPSDPQVFGYEKQKIVNDGTTVYRGKGLRFRFVGGRYSIKIVGTGIDVAAVGGGTVRLTGAGTLDDGRFSLDGAPFKSVPSALTVGGFGQQASTTTLPIPVGG